MYKPLTIVVFGATGDLFKKKLSRAFANLYHKGSIPENTALFGFSRKDISDEDFRDIVTKNIAKEDKKAAEKFLPRMFYRQGDISSKKTYEDLKQELLKRDEELGECSNKLFYLAVVPDLYETVFRNLSASGLTIPCAPEFTGDEPSWIRILVEKPFGSNQIHAEMLDTLLGKLFSEDQIFRIDHYLAKETMQNILAFRFANSLFEPLWSRKHIEKIEINAFEDTGVKGRGVFYDKVGALKDVGQNHLLQMLALVTMEPPKSLSPQDIRKSRAELFENVRVMEESEFVIGQYKDYVLEEGISQFSETETYFKATLCIDNERFKGVPITLSHGKALSHTKAEIKITFKDNEGIVNVPIKKISNSLIFHIQPYEGISVEFFAKKTGLTSELERKTLSFDYENENSNPFIYPYEKLLTDAIAGDQTLFVSTEEIKEEWKIVGDIEKVFASLSLCIYEQGENPENIGRD